MKKVVFFLIFFLFVGLVPHVFAQTAPATQGFVPLAPIPGLTQGVTADTAGLANFFNNLYKYLIGLAAIFAVIEIIWGGLQISTQDSVSKQGEGRERIQQALFGLALVLSPVLVFSIINPNILNLSLNLPKLDTATGGTPGSGPGSGPGGGVIDPVTKCNTTGTLLKKTSCPTAAAAQDFVTKCASGKGRLLVCENVKADGTCGDANQAICESSDAGPYMFVDVSSKYIPSIVTPVLFSSYQPQASSPSNPNSGAEALQFATTCSQDGGLTCIVVTVSAVPCTYTGTQPSSQNNKCYLNKINCIENTTAKASCESPSNWKPIQ